MHVLTKVACSDVGVLSAQVLDGSGVPDQVMLNGMNCTMTVTGLPPMQPPKGAAEEGGTLTTSNGRILGVDGNELFLIGINWFGFEQDGGTMVDGLWAGAALATLICFLLDALASCQHQGAALAFLYNQARLMWPQHATFGTMLLVQSWV